MWATVPPPHPPRELPLVVTTLTPGQLRNPGEVILWKDVLAMVHRVYNISCLLNVKVVAHRFTLMLTQLHLILTPHFALQACDQADERLRWEGVDIEERRREVQHLACWVRNASPSQILLWMRTQHVTVPPLDAVSISPLFHSSLGLSQAVPDVT
ncbi:MAG: hypothetical protein MJE68_11965 [Proteobacteria bacterium]|nr:hypothetical protein [Pseudomonadota bacterium]